MLLKRFSYAVIVLLLTTCYWSCAKRGMPQGGALDSIPPAFVNAKPPNYTTNFNSEEIKIYFDEYIKLDNPNRQIIISPPMDPKPVILPLGSPSKYVTIKVLDTLAENTTYTVNFGKSITDNNEGNPLPFFKYVFSTGSYVDSLSVSGSVKDAYNRKTDEYVSILLYEIDSTYTDSVPYLKNPTYIAYTQDSTNTFTIENMKAGKYRVVALKDKNENYKYEPTSDKIGFLDDTISLPTQKQYDLTVFKEELDFQIRRPKQVSRTHLIFGFRGNPDSTDIALISKRPNDFDYRIIKDAEKDTLHYWFKPYFETDSLLFQVKNRKYADTVTTKIRDMKKDSLVVSALAKGSLGLDDDFMLTANIPFEKIDTTFISLEDRDSIPVSFEAKFDRFDNQYRFQFKKEEKENYRLTLLPGALTDFYENRNDTLRYRFKTPALSDLATASFTIQNIDHYPVIVQLTSDKDETVQEIIHQKEEGNVFNFKNIKPSNYYVRLIYDDNGNGKYDSGNYLKGIQPEKVIYFPEAVEMHANWDISQSFILK